jgi:uncharacterized protein (DUF2336 family)
MAAQSAQAREEAPRSFLQELDDTILRGSPESRLRALWHTTDLLLAGRYTEDQIWVFGEVIGRLADEIETVTRAELSRRLSRADNAPVAVVNRLALDDVIAVAAPVLQHSERVDSRTLLESARAKSQDHLLAISQRKSISTEVTDVLVSRGNAQVANTVASNKGARFSEFGFLALVKRCDGDAILAEHLGLRKDIPRQVFQQLIAKASDEVRKKLEKERPELTTEVHSSVADVTGALHAKFGPASEAYFAAKKAVTAKFQSGILDENTVLDYAQAHKQNEVMIALSLLCALPVNVVERVLHDNNRSMLLVLAKAMNYTWPTTTALLFLAAPDFRMSARDFEDLKMDFLGLNVATSRSILRFYQTRKQATQAGE